ncbi:MAG TPA: DUF1802 family protein [Gemmataceae bacterium]|jgi:hypothetical protein|nr:DUF1802 family protein [Gemmataceae bacterium]
MLQIAFKEWAVVCKALATGEQAIILRKGGIAEAGGEFTPEHSRFWLYPTYLHEHRDGIKEAATPLLEQAIRERPPAGIMRLTHFAEVTGVFDVRQEDLALALDDMHIWSEMTVREKFHYRRTGIYVLPVRIYRAGQPHEVPELPEYAGCRTWVDLKQELPTEAAQPVLDDRAYGEILRALDRRLNPIAFA